MAKKSKLILVDDLKEEVIVGNYYLVPTAILVNKFLEVVAEIPVINNLHKDPQLGVSYMHYHPDLRFIRKHRLLTIYSDGTSNNIFSVDSEIHEPFVLTIENKKRKCVRLKSGIKPPNSAEKYWNWYDEQLEKSCKGKKCPHLGQIMQDKGDFYECPLHGLIGNKTTNKIIKRGDSPSLSPKDFSEFLNNFN